VVEPKAIAVKGSVSVYKKKESQEGGEKVIPVGERGKDMASKKFQEGVRREATVQGTEKSVTTGCQPYGKAGIQVGS